MMLLASLLSGSGLLLLHLHVALCCNHGLKLPICLYSVHALQILVLADIDAHSLPHALLGSVTATFGSCAAFVNE